MIASGGIRIPQAAPAGCGWNVAWPPHNRRGAKQQRL